jgi:hypothetical protein
LYRNSDNETYFATFFAPLQQHVPVVAVEATHPSVVLSLATLVVAFPVKLLFPLSASGSQGILRKKHLNGTALRITLKPNT